MLARRGEQLQENALRIVREDVYTDMGTEGERQLVSLGEIGFSDPKEVQSLSHARNPEEDMA